MKHISQLFLSIAALCAVLASCSREEETLQQSKYISFQASVGKYQVKATDTAFEKGDAVGLVVGEPLNIYNEKLTWDGSALKPAQPISWGETAKNQKVQFAAYYPYQAVPSPEDKADLEFTVKPDQSTHAGYTASDLMVAMTEATPAAESVHLSFEHLLSKVVIKIENHLDVGISEVYMGDVYGKIWVDINDSPEAVGSKGTIKAGKVTVDGGEAWALIVVPAKNLNPTLMITTADQKQYTYTIDNPIEFKHGRRYGASIVLDKDAIFTDFTSDITDWVDDADLQFGQDPGPGPEPEYEGEGTAENPYTVADALALTKNLSWTSNTVFESVGPFYVEGIVSKVESPYGIQFGNANFAISADGSLDSPQFAAYQVYFLENQKWVASYPQVEVGDAVIIYAPLMNYQEKLPETVGKKGYVYSLNGITLISDLPEDDPIPTSEPKGTGTLEDPYNAVAVNAAIKAGAIPAGTTVFVAGKIAEISEAFATKFGNASFYINDSGDARAESFLCFRVLYLGNRKWVDGDASLAIGDEVVVAGEVTLYTAADGSTLPETVASKAYLYSLNGEGAPEEEKTSWTIQEVLQEPDGMHVVIENAIVYAVSSRGFVVSEHPNSESSLMVYSGYMDEDLSPGDHVYIQGVKGTYNHVPQISVTAEEDYYNRWHDDNSEMEWLNYSAIKIDEFLPLEVKPCYLTGIMDYTWKDNTGYFSVKPSGAERALSLYWPYCPTAEHYDRLTRMNGFTVTACGFSLGYADDGPYSYMMYRNVQVVDANSEVTIALLLNDEEALLTGGQYFKVSGTVSEVKDREYGNFYIKDESGNQLLIYGTKDECGNYPGKWSMSGRDFSRVVSVGRKVTVIGALYKYGNEVELADCYIIKSE